MAVTPTSSATQSATEPDSFTPYIPASQSPPEFTWQAVLVGAVLGILFSASSLYLVLRVGMTVSASIPVAVLSITLFRALSRAFNLRPATILENNITQTAGSAGESIAFGVGVTMPALMILGFDMSIGRVMVVSVLGGLLGILMMIPLRRAFIVNMHGKPGQPDTLLYPEGTACAEVLISGEKGGTSGQTVFIGFGIAFFAKFLLEGMSIMATTIALPLKAFYNRVAQVSTDLGPELIGVGYVIGIRVAAIMMAGAVIGNLVIVPAIVTFGDGLPTIIAPASKLIREMSLGEIQANYLRFIGAGCVTAAGIISMLRTMPMIVRSFRASLGKLRTIKQGGAVSRTDLDMSPRTVLFGSLGLLALLAIFLIQELTLAEVAGAWWKGVLGGILVLTFGFLFVTVSSRLTGEIGSSSNPISGMTVATLALTCLIFLALQLTSPIDKVIALSIGAVVCIAASNGGTTSQDLKTGFLVGGTPVYQQYAILIGALSSALVIGVILMVFNQAGTVVTSRNLPSVKLSKEQYDSLKEQKSVFKKQYRVWTVKEGDPSGVRPGVWYVDENRRTVVNGSALKKSPDYTLSEEAYTALESSPKVTFQGVEYRVWKPGHDIPQGVPTGTWLVDAKRQLVLNLDAIEDLPVYALSKTEFDDLKERITYDGTTYRVWRPRDGDPSGVQPGKYYIDDNRRIAYLEDPAITGRVKYRDDESEVKMKFEAPKTAVIGIIINGVLEQKLNWGLVLVGAMLAVGIELCGVSSLAFAVGVYIPMQYSTPIFLGGLVRWLVDSSMTKPSGDTDEAHAIAETETGPGVLLSSGYIAGGTIAGVLIAFIELPFFKTIKDMLNFSVKTADGAAPRLQYNIQHPWIEGLDLAPLPVLLFLLGFLILVGWGWVLKPTKEEKA